MKDGHLLRDPFRGTLVINLALLALAAVIVLLVVRQADPHSERELAYLMLMLILNGAGVLANAILAIAAALFKKGKLAAGAGLSILLWALLGFGLCWGGSALVGA